MTDNELIELLDDIESDRVERKEAPSEVDRIRQAMKRNGNPQPEFQVEDAHVAVILGRRTCIFP